MHAVRNLGALVAALAILLAAATWRGGGEWPAAIPACLGAIGVLAQYLNPINTRNSRYTVFLTLCVFCASLLLSAILVFAMAGDPIAILFVILACAIGPLMMKARGAYRQIPQYKMMRYFTD